MKLRIISSHTFSVLNYSHIILRKYECPSLFFRSFVYYEMHTSRNERYEQWGDCEKEGKKRRVNTHSPVRPTQREHKLGQNQNHKPLEPSKNKMECEKNPNKRKVAKLAQTKIHKPLECPEKMHLTFFVFYDFLL